jgi:hypothetical protein
MSEQIWASSEISNKSTPFFHCIPENIVTSIYAGPKAAQRKELEGLYRCHKAMKLSPNS